MEESKKENLLKKLQDYRPSDWVDENAKWYFSDDEMIDFANQLVQEKLKKVADKIEYLSSETEITTFYKGHNTACDKIKFEILSLINN